VSTRTLGFNPPLRRQVLPRRLDLLLQHLPRDPFLPGEGLQNRGDVVQRELVHLLHDYQAAGLDDVEVAAVPEGQPSPDFGGQRHLALRRDLDYLSFGHR